MVTRLEELQTKADRLERSCAALRHKLVEAESDAQQVRENKRSVYSPCVSLPVLK